MSLHINFCKSDETKVLQAIRKSHPSLGASIELTDIFEVDYSVGESDGSINGVSDDFKPDTGALLEALRQANVPVYGALEEWESGWTLYAAADGRVVSADAISGSDYPAVRVNPDGSIEQECVAEAIEYWTAYKAAYKAIHGVDSEVA